MNLEKLAELALRGLSLTQAAKELGLSYSHVAKTARENNIRFPDQRPFNSGKVGPRATHYNELLAQGKTLAEIAAHFGVTTHAVSMYVRRHLNVPRTPGQRIVDEQRRQILAELPKSVREDVKTLMTAGGYSFTRALKVATKQMRSK